MLSYNQPEPSDFTTIDAKFPVGGEKTVKFINSMGVKADLVKKIIVVTEEVLASGLESGGQVEITVSDDDIIELRPHTEP